MMHRLTVYVDDVVIEQAEARARDEGILRDNGSGDVLRALTGLFEAYARDRIVVLPKSREVKRELKHAEPTGVDYVAEKITPPPAPSADGTQGG